jgi:hypothetical protein
MPAWFKQTSTGPSCASHSASASRRRPRERTSPTEPHRVDFPQVDDAHRLVDPAELEQRLCVVRRPRARVRSAPSKRRGLPVRFSERLCGRRRVPAPERDEPRNCLQQRRTKADLLIAELQRSLRLREGELYLPSMDGDPCDRDVVLVLLDAVLDVDVARMARVLGGALPQPSPELEPRETPEHLGREQFVALVPLSILAFEHSAAGIDLERVGEHAGMEHVRLPYQLRIAGSRR